MKYSFTTPAKERVTLDRSVLNGKVKVYVDNKPVAPSHQGTRGAAGTFYPLRSGTLEIRSSLWELVPRAWYNEDWVDLVPPLNTWQYLLIALPFLGTVFITFFQLPGLVVGGLAVLISLMVMRSQRPLNTRVVMCLIIAVLAPVAALAVTYGFTMLMNGAR
jgi:hypothetical protein